MDFPFGVYLKGSVFRKTDHSASDVDLVVLLDPQINIHQFMKIKDQIGEMFPEWKKRELDIQYIVAENKRPPKAADIISLAFLYEHGKCFLGTDLRRYCYPVTWADFLYCLHRDAVYRLKEFSQFNEQQILDEMNRRNSSKFFYSAAFSVLAYLHLEIQRDKWLFAPEEISDPLFQEIKSLIRDKLKYSLPKQPEDVSQFKTLFSRFLKITQEFPVLSR